MDEHSLSLLLYYGFECKEDTNYTCQVCYRFENSLQQFMSDNLSNYYSKSFLHTGSANDGTPLTNSFTDSGNKVLSSDHDSMEVSHECQVYPFGFSESYDVSKDCLQMARSPHTRPGFCLLQGIGDTHADIDLYFNIKNSDFHKLYNDYENNGPAFTGIILSDGGTILHDQVIALKCNQWLNDCRIWPTVINGGWPSLKLQSDIKNEGFHLV